MVLESECGQPGQAHGDHAAVLLHAQAVLAEQAPGRRDGARLQPAQQALTHALCSDSAETQQGSLRMKLWEHGLMGPACSSHTGVPKNTWFPK